MPSQGRNHDFFLGKQRQWVGIICPFGWDRVNVSENLGKVAVLSALLLITPLLYNLILKIEDGFMSDAWLLLLDL